MADSTIVIWRDRISPNGTSGGAATLVGAVAILVTAVAPTGAGGVVSVFVCELVNVFISASLQLGSVCGQSKAVGGINA